jgi:7,8-dihydropterin-6-yl-methyl-4-(beta-D-ribofuranosyl)aminobenzene 5'-phosphate synthase
MNVSLEIREVDRVSITILVDNKADLMLESTDQIKYFTEKPLLAEHGFSALIQLDESDDRILWDAGVSRIALIENMRRMNISSSSISAIALSHGHMDHYAAMTVLLEQMDLVPEDKVWEEVVTQDVVEAWREGHRIPIVAHPAAFRERWWLKDDGNLVGPFRQPPEEMWLASGAKVVRSEDPYELAPGCWTTGYIPRESFEESGRPSQLRYRSGDDFIPDDIEEDQAIVINVRDKGLIVLSGCAHSGILNTINHALNISGIDRIYAIIGGFHLAHADDEEINVTIEQIKALKPSYVIPSHCTGFAAIQRFSQDLPDEFVEGVVGASYLL